MEAVYDVVRLLLPFSVMQYDFMINALLAVLLVTPLFGLIGPLVVDQKLAFFSDALGHSALTGIAIGVILGIADPLIAMIGFAVLFALLLTRIRRSQTASSDTVISVFSSTAIALGLILLSMEGGFNRYSAYLIGDILTIAPGEIVTLLLTFAGVAAFLLLCYHRLLALSVNRVLARSRGIPVRLLETLFVTVIALLVTISIRWVGILLINSLLILPAAASRNIARGMRQYLALSVGFSLLAGVGGLLLAFYLNVPSGPAIVLICAAFFFVTFALKPAPRANRGA